MTKMNINIKLVFNISIQTSNNSYLKSKLCHFSCNFRVIASQEVKIFSAEHIWHKSTVTQSKLFACYYDQNNFFLFT